MFHYLCDVISICVTSLFLFSEEASRWRRLLMSEHVSLLSKVFSLNVVLVSADILVSNIFSFSLPAKQNKLEGFSLTISTPGGNPVNLYGRNLQIFVIR